MNSSYSSVRLALVLVTILGAVLLIHLSTESKLSYAQQKGLTNTSTILNKTGPSIQVHRPIGNATAQKIGNISNHLSTKPEFPVYTVSSSATFTYTYLSDFSKLYHECPEQVVILVHGLSNTSPPQIRSLEEFDRAAISIESNHYYFPIIGFLWPSNPDVNLLSNKKHASDSLADFLTDFRYNCKSTTIRIVAHSMGAEVVSNAINDLNANPRWTDNKYKIESIHFLGSNLNSESPSKDTPFGGFVEKFVGYLHNFYSPSDDKLAFLGSVLGNTGASRKITTPINYLDMDVAKEIENHLTMREDHLAYWGLRDTSHHVIDDGAMNVVVSDWMKSSPTYGEIIDLPIGRSSPSNATIIPR